MLLPCHQLVCCILHVHTCRQMWYTRRQTWSTLVEWPWYSCVCDMHVCTCVHIHTTTNMTNMLHTHTGLIYSTWIPNWYLEPEACTCSATPSFPTLFCVTPTWQQQPCSNFQGTQWSQICWCCIVQNGITWAFVFVNVDASVYICIFIKKGITWLSHDFLFVNMNVHMYVCVYGYVPKLHNDPHLQGLSVLKCHEPSFYW
jgi:hypothetical protein